MAGQFTGKQQKFIDAYLGEANCNAYLAAKLAGYKGNGKTLRATASRLLTYDNIKAEIASHFEANAMSKEELLSLLGDQARIDTSEYYNEMGYFDLARFKKDGYGHLIKSIKLTKYGPVIEFISKEKSQELIGRHLALFTDKVEQETTHKVSESSMDALRDRIFGIKERQGNRDDINQSDE
jgi:phage terminase small subunit